MFTERVPACRRRSRRPDVPHFGVNEFLLLATGLRWTVALTALAFVGSGLLGLIVLLLRTGRARLLRWVALIWIQAVKAHRCSDTSS